MILSDPEKGRRLLSSAGFIVQSTEVMALEVSDNPGSLQQVLETFSLAGINIQYVYAFGTKLSEKAMIILKPDDLHQAEKLCLQAGAKSLSPKEVEAAVLADPNTARYLNGGAPRKVIVVPGKIINIVC